MQDKKITIDDLARLAVENHNEIKDQLGQLDNRMNSLEGSMSSLERRMNGLEVGHEDIKLRLDNVAHRFELNDLKQRVTVLEKKASFSK